MVARMHSRTLDGPGALLVWLWLAPLVSSRADAPCYNPAGTRQDGHFPCDPTAYITNCCPDGWTCFSNALCIVTTHTNAFPNLTMGAVVRGMCTNPLWNNEICGDRCLDGDNVNGELVYCGDHKFCCLGDYKSGLCDCTSSGNSFVINDGRAQTVLGVTDTTFSGVPSIATSRPPLSTQSAKTTRSSSSRPSSSSHSLTSTASATSTPSSAAAPTSTPEPVPPSPSNRGLAVGLGVAIPVVAIAGLLALWRFWWYPRHHHPRRPHVSFHDDVGDDGTAMQQHLAGTADDLTVVPPLSFGHGGYGGVGGRRDHNDLWAEPQGHTAPPGDLYDADGDDHIYGVGGTSSG